MAESEYRAYTCRPAADLAEADSDVDNNDYRREDDSNEALEQELASGSRANVVRVEKLYRSIREGLRSSSRDIQKYSSAA